MESASARWGHASWVFVMAGLLAVGGAWAQAAPPPPPKDDDPDKEQVDPLISPEPGHQPWEEYSKLIQSKTTVAAHGPDLFGDNVNLYNGALSFSVTDLSVPGNAGLPVALTRTFNVSSRPPYALNDLPFADWDIDLPRLSGVFATHWPNDRCSSTAAAPSVSAGSTVYNASDYWHGNHAHMPAGGEMLVADRGAPVPAGGGAYPWMTPAFTYFSCLSSIKNGAGEGFLAIAPDGTRYWFDWMAQYVGKSGKPAAEPAGSDTQAQYPLRHPRRGPLRQLGYLHLLQQRDSARTPDGHRGERWPPHHADL